MQQSGSGDVGVVSIVLLLRQPHYFLKDELRRAAEAAWGGISFAGGGGSKYFVVQTGVMTILKAARHTLSFLNASRPYLDDDPAKIAKRLPKLSQQKAWAEHRAWTAVDYLKGGNDVELEFCILARLVAEMLSANCAGLYLPGERSFMPNDSSLYSVLQEIAASRNSEIA